MQKIVYMLAGILLLATVHGLAQTNGTKTNTFPDSGSVGIGTMEPGSLLQVGNTNSKQTAPSTAKGAGGNVSIQASNQTLNIGLGTVSPWSAWIQSFSSDGSGAIPLVLNPSGGNIGIGTTTPVSTLHVSGRETLDDHGYFELMANGVFTGTDDKYLSTGYAGRFEFDSNVGSWYFETAPKGNAGGSLSYTKRLTILNSGNVGIGTKTPNAALEVAGNVRVSGNGNSIIFPDNTSQVTAWLGYACGGDYAESVDVAGDRATYEPGDLLVLGPDSTSDVAKSSEPYSTLVAGIYSTKPGLVGRRQTTDKSQSKTEIPMAMVGIVPTKVSAENGPIKRGDLLVTSSTQGYAMKGTDTSRMFGAVIGKAMGSLDSGTGVIEVLVTLQ